MAQPSAKKTLCHAPFLVDGVLGRSPCHPAPSPEHTVMASEFERYIPTVERALCHSPFLVYGVFGRSPCNLLLLKPLPEAKRRYLPTLLL